MEIIGLEKDERILAKAEKSGGRVIRTIVTEIIILILFAAIVNPFIFQWAASQYSISYESWGDLIVSAITAKAADYVFGVFLMIENAAVFFQAVIHIILALIRHSRRELYLTDHRILSHTGNLLIGKKDFNLPLSHIKKIGVRENAVSRLFGYGVVEMDTPLGQYSVDGIGNPHDFLRMLNQQKFGGDGIPKENREALGKEYAKTPEEDGIPYRRTETTEKTEPILEKKERVMVFISVGMYILGIAGSLFLLNETFEMWGGSLWKWFGTPLGSGTAIAGFLLFLLIVVLMVRLEPPAYQFLQFMLIFSMTVTGFAVLLLLADENFPALLPQLLLLTESGVLLYLVRYILEVLGSTVQRYRRGRGH